MKQFRIRIQFLILAFVLCQLISLSESRRHKSKSSRRSEEDDDDDDRSDNLGRWDKLVNMKNRLKVLKKGGRKSKESDENSYSSSEENLSRPWSRKMGRGLGRSSIFPTTKYESVETERFGPKKYKGDGTLDSKQDSEDSEENSEEIGKLSNLFPGKFGSIRHGLKRRLKNIVPYCPDLHTVTVLKDWGQMFKDKWPNFFKMGKKSVDYANDLRKQMLDCAKHYVSKQIIKGKGGRHDKDGSDESDENDSDEKGRLPKSHQITKGADGKTRTLFKDDDDSDEDGDLVRKREVEAGDAEKLVAEFKTKYVEPVIDYFEKLPEMVTALNMKQGPGLQ